MVGSSGGVELSSVLCGGVRQGMPICERHCTLACCVPLQLKDCGRGSLVFVAYKCVERSIIGLTNDDTSLWRDATIISDLIQLMDGPSRTSSSSRAMQHRCPAELVVLIQLSYLQFNLTY